MLRVKYLSRYFHAWSTELRRNIASRTTFDLKRKFPAHSFGIAMELSESLLHQLEEFYGSKSNPQSPVKPELGDAIRTCSEASEELFWVEGMIDGGGIDLLFQSEPNMHPEAADEIVECVDCVLNEKGGIESFCQKSSRIQKLVEFLNLVKLNSSKCTVFKLLTVICVKGFGADVFEVLKNKEFAPLHDAVTLLTDQHWAIFEKNVILVFLNTFVNYLDSIAERMYVRHLLLNTGLGNSLKDISISQALNSDTVEKIANQCEIFHMMLIDDLQTLVQLNMEDGHGSALSLDVRQILDSMRSNIFSSDKILELNFKDPQSIDVSYDIIGNISFGKQKPYSSKSRKSIKIPITSDGMTQNHKADEVATDKLILDLQNALTKRFKAEN